MESKLLNLKADPELCDSNKFEYAEPSEYEANFQAEPELYNFRKSECAENSRLQKAALQTKPLKRPHVKPLKTRKTNLYRYQDISESKVKSKCANPKFQDVHMAQPQLSYSQDISNFTPLLKPTDPKVENQVFTLNLQAMQELSCSTTETPPVYSTAQSLPACSAAKTPAAYSAAKSLPDCSAFRIQPACPAVKSLPASPLPSPC